MSLARQVDVAIRYDHSVQERAIMGGIACAVCCCCVCVCVCVQDTDECSTNPSSCQSGTCVNTYGGYYCLNPSFVGQFCQFLAQISQLDSRSKSGFE